MRHLDEVSVKGFLEDVQQQISPGISKTPIACEHFDLEITVSSVGSSSAHPDSLDQWLHDEPVTFSSHTQTDLDVSDLEAKFSFFEAKAEQSIGPADEESALDNVEPLDWLVFSYDEYDVCDTAIGKSSDWCAWCDSDVPSYGPPPSNAPPAVPISGNLASEAADARMQPPRYKPIYNRNIESLRKRRVWSRCH